MKLRPTPISLRIATLGVATSLVASLVSCDSGQSVNTGDGVGRLSHASNNISDGGAWSLDNTNVDERWDQDPTIMEPDYPYAGSQPGFGTSSFPDDGS